MDVGASACCYLATTHPAPEVLQTLDVILPFSGGQESTYFYIKHIPSDVSDAVIFAKYILLCAELNKFWRETLEFLLRASSERPRFNQNLPSLITSNLSAEFKWHG